MCILFIEFCPCPAEGGFRLILASNRDEYYRRPTENAHHWTEAPHVIGGRDMEPGREGGTWLALDTAGSGRVAVLLNVMGGLSSPTALGRGSLVADFVRGTESAKDYTCRIADRGHEYNAFHFVAVDMDPSRTSEGVWHYSNCSSTDGVGSGVTHIREGHIYLGNSLADRPFKKVSAGGQRFSDIVQRLGCHATQNQLVKELVALLKWSHEHIPDEELNVRGEKAKMTQETRKLCSSIFQQHPTYGTRTHTIVLIDSKWKCDFYEWTLEAPSNPATSDWVYTHKEYELSPLS